MHCPSARHWELIGAQGHYFVTSDKKKQCLTRALQSVQGQKALRQKKKGAAYDSKMLFNSAVMQSCEEGGASLQVENSGVHDRGFLLLGSDSTCFDGTIFRRCDPSSPSQVWGVRVAFTSKGDPTRSFHRWSDPTKCLVREGSKISVGKCTDSGAKRWGLQRGQLSQGDGAFCVVRDLKSNAHAQKCSTGFEYFQMGMRKTDAIAAAAGSSPASGSGASSSSSASAASSDAATFRERARYGQV